MKIAFYLGSFNPFHNGHLKVIETAFNRDGINKVVIVPTMQSPWKHNKVLDLYSRCNIINLSIMPLLRIYGKNSIQIDLVERELESPYYSYKTLSRLKEEYNSKEDNSLYFLCGQDTIDSIPRWRDGDKIIKEWEFIVVDRPEGSISSSEIRRLVRECKDISPYVHNRVKDMIKRYYFYEV